MATNPSTSLFAEYEAAITAYREKVVAIIPTRKEYDVLITQHKQNTIRYKDVLDKSLTHRITYLRHKQYVSSLTNALLASNIKLRSAPRPFTDVQALTHATILNDLRLASEPFITMIVKNKRLEKARDKCWTRDQELCTKGKGLSVIVEKNWKEQDQLHHRVLEAEKKMGAEPGCGMVEGKCISCVRMEEEAKSMVAAAAAAAVKVVKETKRGSGKVRGGNVGKGAEGKQKLEDILEEEEGAGE